MHEMMYIQCENVCKMKVLILSFHPGITSIRFKTAPITKQDRTHFITDRPQP